MRITLQTFLISLAMFLSLQNVSSVQAHSLDDVLSGEHRSDNNKLGMLVVTQKKH